MGCCACGPPAGRAGHGPRTWPFPPQWEAWRSSKLLSLAWLRPSCCRHSERKSAGGRPLSVTANGSFKTVTSTVCPQEVDEDKRKYREGISNKVNMAKQGPGQGVSAWNSELVRKLLPCHTDHCTAPLFLTLSFT